MRERSVNRVVQLSSIHASLIALAVLAAPTPDRSDCSTLGERYTGAVAKVVEALRTYEKCVAASDKRNDCANEMQALDHAHDDFVDTVDDAKDCQ
jgi:hypothetical protein